jgi:hypothetical protein
LLTTLTGCASAQKLGILSLLDEESRFPKGTDDTFLLKLTQTHAKAERFAVPRLAAAAFTITHYAGAVAYDTRGFLEKNRDKFPDDLLELMQGSANPLVAALFESESVTSGMPIVPCPCQQLQLVEASVRHRRALAPRRQGQAHHRAAVPRVSRVLDGRSLPGMFPCPVMTSSPCRPAYPSVPIRRTGAPALCPVH